MQPPKSLDENQAIQTTLNDEKSKTDLQFARIFALRPNVNPD